MKHIKDGVVFNDGQKVYANCGILGINESLDIFEGYDGGVDNQCSWTAEQRKELAEYMIELWRRFGEGKK